MNLKNNWLEVEWSNVLCRKHSRRQDRFCDIYWQILEQYFAKNIYSLWTKQRHLLVKNLFGFQKSIAACYFLAGIVVYRLWKQATFFPSKAKKIFTIFIKEVIFPFSRKFPQFSYNFQRTVLQLASVKFKLCRFHGWFAKLFFQVFNQYFFVNE